MTMNTVLTKLFTPPPFNTAEILRYAGAKEATYEISHLMNECIKEAENILSYKVCYCDFSNSLCNGKPMPFFENTESTTLKNNLSGCRGFILFAATVGIHIDRLIAKYGRTSPSKALMFQAIGTERIESLCDEFEKFVTKEYGNTVPRFSPGYGDLSLDLQNDFFRILRPENKIGLTLNKSILMSPSKSVTAIIGITDNCLQTQKHNCSNCNKTNCSFRR